MKQILLSALLAACAAFAQDRGTITGTVTDSSKAVVPGATVSLKSPATGLSQTATSGDDGNYNFVYLPVGGYSLTVEKQGFKKAEANDVVVLVNTTTRVDLQMQVGSTQETVEVTGAPPLLQSDRSDLGRVVENVVIERLPLFANGGLRSNNSFALLNPGVYSTIGKDPDNGDGGAVRVAGGKLNGNSQLVDGAESMSERRNDPQMRVVSAEGIQEFKVQTGAYSAEFGRTSNGIMNYSTKSGTNEFHGSLFGQLRNNALNAKGFFYGAHTPAVHNQNLEAASVGGPIWIPKVYNGRNKLFFFFSGERSRAKDVDAPGLITLPIQDFRNGDFRKYTDSSGNMIPLYDPFNADGSIISDATQRPRMQCNGVLNVICPERLDRVSKTIMDYVPLPDMPGQVFNNTYSRINGFRTPGENQGVYSIKSDFYATQKLRVNGMFSKTYFNGYPLQGAIPGPVSDGFQEFGDFKWVRANADYVLSPSLLNHFTFGYNQRDLGEGAIATNKAYHDATALPGANTSLVDNYSAYTTEMGNFGSSVHTRSPGRTWNVKEQLAWLKGRHSIKFGFDYIRPNYERNDCNDCSGWIGTDAASTSNPGVDGTTGIQFASFMLGLGSYGDFNYHSDINFIYHYYAWYVQDDFKVNNKLTLNMGLRYDLPITREEANHQNSNFNPTIPNPGANGRLGALEFAGTGAGRSGRNILQYTRKNGFGPRFGFAYQVTPKTVVRSGASIVYDSIREDGNADSGVQGFGGYYETPDNFYATGISIRFSDGFNAPGLKELVDAGRPKAGGTIDPSLANYGSPTYRTGEAGKPGYFIDYNLTVEHSFTSSTLWRGSYHGNNGVKTQATQNFNRLDPQYWAKYGTLLGASVSDPAVQATGFQLPYASFPTNLSLAQALRPYPQYSGVSGYSLSGHSTFNALETSFEHRFNSGLYALASYTFSKAMQSYEGQNVYARLTDKAIADFDRTHVMAFSYIYDLPIGKNRRFLSGMNSVLNAVVGDWSIAGVQRYQSGVPLSPTCGQQMYGAGLARCDIVAGQPLYNPSWNPNDPNSPYINRQAFVQPSSMHYGNMPAKLSQLREPWQMNEDVAVSKSFKFSEKKSLEFRGSAFNLSNRHILGSFTTGATSGTFGNVGNPQSNQPRNVEFSLRFAY